MTPNELVWPPTDSKRRCMIVLHRIEVHPRGSTVDQATGVTTTLAHIIMDGMYTAIQLIIPPDLIQDETRRARNLDYDSVTDILICLYVDVYGNFFPTTRYGEATGTTRNAGLTLNVIRLNVHTEVPNETYPFLSKPAGRLIAPVRGRGRSRDRGGSTATRIAIISQPQPQPQRRAQSATAITSGQEKAAVTKEQTDENRRVTRSQKRKAEEQPEAESSTAAQKRRVKEQRKAEPTAAAQKRKVREQPETEPSTAAQEVKVEEQPEAEASSTAQKRKFKPTRKQSSTSVISKEDSDKEN